MTPQARTQSVIEILERAQTGRVPLDSVVGDHMRTRRFIGSKDRRFIAERVYQTYRHFSRFTWLAKQFKAKPTPRVKALLGHVFFEDRSAKEIEKMFSGAQYAPDELNDDERNLLEAVHGKALDMFDFPEDIECECPPEYFEHLKAIFGDDFKAEMHAMLEEATLDIRVNVLNADKDKVQNSLEAENLKFAPLPYAPHGFRFDEKLHLSKTKAMQKGWIDIQDEGSQLIAAVCDAKPGMQVIDYCAGAGGKTLALSCDMQAKGRIVAMDNDARRLAKAKPRLKRARASDIIELRSVEETRHRKWLKRQADKFDICLLDVPCSGTGTWRRNPDMRWHHYGPSLDELKETQAQILDVVAHAVKPAGRLVYATCSLLREENEDQIEAFLARNSEYELGDVSKLWPEGLKCPVSGPYMRLSPYKHQTDGFFASILIKKGTPAPKPNFEKPEAEELESKEKEQLKLL